MIAGCVPNPPKKTVISKSAAFRPATPGDVTSVEEAFRAIITVCSEKLGLPTVDPLVVNLHESNKSFSYWGRTIGFHNEIPDVIAFATGNEIHINLEQAAGKSWGMLLGTIAHEYAHTIHRAIENGESKTETWFREGFASWIESQVLEALGWQSTSLSTRRAEIELSNHFRRNTDRIELLDQGRWIAAQKLPDGYLSTYVLAELVVSRLAEHGNAIAILSYAQSGNFQESFGRGKDEVLAEIDKSLRRKHTLGQRGFVVNRPVWNLGFEWTYEESRSGRKSIISKTNERKENINNVASFVLTAGDQLEIYREDTLGLLETRRGNVVITKREKSNEFFSWPLFVDKEWRNSFKLEDLEQRVSGVSDRHMRVSGIETLRVRAGVFQSIKIEAFDSVTRRLLAEYWYSPEVRWFIKTTNYELSNSYFVERELVSFKLRSFADLD